MVLGFSGVTYNKKSSDHHHGTVNLFCLNFVFATNHNLCIFLDTQHLVTPYPFVYNRLMFSSRLLLFRVCSVVTSVVPFLFNGIVISPGGIYMIILCHCEH